MPDNIKVKPSSDATAVPVKTDVIGGEHVPVYKGGYGEDGEFTPVSPNNPLPITMVSLTNQQTNLVTHILDRLDDLVLQQKITNAYLSEAHDETLTREDIED